MVLKDSLVLKPKLSFIICSMTLVKSASLKLFNGRHYWILFYLNFVIRGGLNCVKRICLMTIIRIDLTILLFYQDDNFTFFIYFLRKTFEIQFKFNLVSVFSEYQYFILFVLLAIFLVLSVRYRNILFLRCNQLCRAIKRV